MTNLGIITPTYLVHSSGVKTVGNKFKFDPVEWDLPRDNNEHYDTIVLLYDSYEIKGIGNVVVEMDAKDVINNRILSDYDLLSDLSDLLMECDDDVQIIAFDVSGLHFTHDVIVDAKSEHGYQIRVGLPVEFHQSNDVTQPSKVDKPTTNKSNLLLVANHLNLI